MSTPPFARRLAGAVLTAILAGCGGLAEADRFYEAKKYPQAIDAYESIYGDYRQDARVNYRVGRSFFAMARFDKAEKFFRRAIEANSKEPDVAWRLAECQDRQKMYSDASKTFQRILDADPQNVAALNNLAVMQIQLDEYEPAQVNLEKALAIDARDRETLFNLGLIYERHHHDDAKASEYFMKFRAVAPDAPQAEEVREWLRRYDTARSTARAAAQESPRVAPADDAPPPAARSTSDDLTDMLGEPAPPRRPTPRESVEATPSPMTTPITRGGESAPMRRSASVDPDGPLGVELFAGLTDREDYDAVLRRFGEARKSDPDYGRYCYYAGLAQLEKKDGAAAVTLLKEAVKRHPDEPDYLLQLGWAMHYRSDGEGARKVWEDGRLRFPDRRDDFARALEVLP